MKNFTTDSNQNFVNMDIDRLIEYIIDIHHSYVRKTFPMLKIIANEECTVYAKVYPELNELKKMILFLTKEIEEHLEKEETILFPNFLEIYQAHKNGTGPDKLISETAVNLISAMNYEHGNAISLIGKIKNKSNNFTPPYGTDKAFKNFYKLLDEFKNDLITHIYLEDEVLFPKFKKLAQEIGLSSQDEGRDTLAEDLDDDLF